MLGAIIGDIVGSRFEWNNIKTKEFEFFTQECTVTDDSIMSLAVAKALLESGKDLDKLSEITVGCLQKLAGLTITAVTEGCFMSGCILMTSSHIIVSAMVLLCV